MTVFLRAILRKLDRLLSFIRWIYKYTSMVVIADQALFLGYTYLDVHLGYTYLGYAGIPWKCRNALVILVILG